VLTSLGVSNVSYGFKPARARRAESVFLYHAVEAGLDMAIVNPKQITPYAEIRRTARAGRRPGLQSEPRGLSAIREPFRGNRPENGSFDGRAGEPFARSSRALASAASEEGWNRAGCRRHRRAVGEGEDRNRIVPYERRLSLSECRNIGGRYLDAHEVLLPAMKEVGDKFGCGELILRSCFNRRR